MSSSKGRSKAPPPKPPTVEPSKLVGKSIKITIPLDPAALLTEEAVDGVSRKILHIDVAGRLILADINMKAFRRAIAVVREAGAENSGLTIIGNLLPDNTIGAAGIQAVAKTRQDNPADEPLAA